MSNYKVTLVSGEEITVQTAAEQRWFNGSRDDYLKQTHFTETTDLRDLDRLLGMELTVFRLTHHLASGQDYMGFEIDETTLRRNVREYSEQINKTKSSMGLNKASRDDALNAHDFPTWLANIKQRAREFGIHREHQLTRALTLMNELSSIVGAYDRADEDERERLGFKDEAELVAWIRTAMLPEFREIDEHFRTHEQKYWIRSI